MALLERVTMHTSRADDRMRLAHLIRVTTAVIASLRIASHGQTLPRAQRLVPPPKAKRQRQLAKAARRRQRCQH